MTRRKNSTNRKERSLRRRQQIENKRALPTTNKIVKESISKTSFTWLLRFSKKLSTSFKILFCTAVVITTIYFLFDISKSQKIKGEFKILGSAGFSLNDSQYSSDSLDDKISPLCGRNIIRRHRGFQFFSQEISYEVNDTSCNKEDSIHQYAFVSPQSDNGPYPKLLFGFKYYLINTKFLNPFEVNDIIFKLLTNKTIEEKKDSIIKRVDIDTAKFIAIFNKSNRLTIFPSDSFPIAALLPAKDSKISISKYHSSYKQQDIGFSILEDYKRNEDTQSQWEIPAMDLFGPRIVIATTPGLVRLNQEFKDFGDTDSSLLALLIFDVAPQLRIVHNKIDSFFLSKTVESGTTLLLRNTIGKVRIESYKLGNKNFQNLKRIVDNLGIWMRPKVLFDSNYEMDGWGLPTVLNCNGIYSYVHSLSSLHSFETFGAIQYGKKPFTLNGQSDILLSNLSNTDIYNQPIVIPLDDCESVQNKCKILTDGEFQLDGDQIKYSNFDNSLWQKLSFVLSLITSISALIILVRDLLLRSKSDSK